MNLKQTILNKQWSIIKFSTIFFYDSLKISIKFNKKEHVSRVTKTSIKILLMRFY